MGIFSNNNFELKTFNETTNFNLNEAIVIGKAHIFFGSCNEEIIDEYYDYEVNDYIIMVRNHEEHGAGHRFTIKLKPPGRKHHPDFIHDGHFGLPITYEKGSNDWNVYLGTEKSKVKKAQRIEEQVLTREEKAFITAFVNEVGDLAIEYWNVNNTHTQKGQNELKEIEALIVKTLVQPIIIKGNESQVEFILGTLSNKEKEDLYLNDYFSENKTTIFRNVIIDKKGFPIAFADLYHIDGDEYNILRASVACVNDSNYRNRRNGTAVLSHTYTQAKFNRYKVICKISSKNEYAKRLANDIDIKYELMR